MKAESREYRVEQGRQVQEPRYVVAVDMAGTYFPTPNNLLLWSEDLTNAAWVGANISVESNVETDPNGEITADRITDATIFSSVIRQTISITASEKYFYAVHFKKDTVSRADRFPDLYVIFTGSTVEQSQVYIDTSTGEFHIPTASNADPNITAGVEDKGNYWRLWMVVRSQDQGNTSAQFGIEPAQGNGLDWLQNSGVFGDTIVWGMQVSDVGELIPYVKTEATAITTAVFDPDYFLSIDNFALWSEDFTNAAHLEVGTGSVVGDTDTDPLGGTTADTLTDSDATSNYLVYQALAVGSTSFRYSVHIKQDAIGRATRFMGLIVQYSGSTTPENNFIYFDTETGDSLIQATDPGATLTVELIVDQVDDPYWRLVFETSQLDTLHNTALYGIYPALGADINWVTSVATQGSVTAWGVQFTNIDSSVKYVKAEGDFVNLKEQKPDILYFTSHDDTLLNDEEVIPINRIDGVVMPRGISGQTQKINPDIAQHTIGSVAIKLLDINAAISARLSDYYLNQDIGLRKKTVQIYQGFSRLQDFEDYALHLTYLVEDLDFTDGVYKLRCSDIQRTTKTDIFEFDVGVLTSTITASSNRIPITIPGAANRFQLIEHDINYSANPSRFVGYIRIDDEIIAHAGWDANLLNLIVVERGALNTRAVTHKVTTTQTDQKKKVEEFGYLEMAVPRMIYYILTGKDPSGKLADLPNHWNLGIAESFITINDFLNIGEDLWDPADDTGRIARFIGLEQVAGKSFIEKELLLWSGCFMPIYSDGTYGLKQLQTVLPFSAYDAALDEEDVISYSGLRYDMKAVINNISIYWNWIQNLDRFTKITQLIDGESIAKNGSAQKKSYEFRGVFSGVHTDNDLVAYFGQVRDRYASPPIRVQVEAGPKWNSLEVGDTVRVTLDQLTDQYINQPLDRTFEVQQVQTDWVTGRARLQLFGGVEPASQVAFSASFVMQDAYYSTQAIADGGTSLTSVLTISGGVVTVNGSLTGASNHNNAIYYYDGDLTIADGVTVTWTNNIQVRARTLTVNGNFYGIGSASISNVGAGGVKGPNNTARDNWRNINFGKYPKTGKGALGTTITGETVHYYDDDFGVEVLSGLFGPKLPRGATREDKIEARTGRGKYGPVTPIPKLRNPDGLSVRGLINDYRGVGGGGGQQAVHYEISGSRLGVAGIANGGDGGQGGGGLVLITRGLFFGGNGKIDTSGGTGAQGQNNIGDPISGGIFSGAPGGPGHPGGMVVLIDGDAPTPDTSKFISKTGTFTAPAGADVYLNKTHQRAAYVNGRRYAPGSHFGFFGKGSVNEQVDGMIRIQYIPAAQDGFVWFPEDENAEVPREGYGDKRIPDDPVNFQAHQAGETVVFKWDKPLFDSAFEIRYAPVGVGSWDDATPLTQTTKGTNITSADVAPGGWTFYCRAVSFLEIYSDNFSQVNLTVTTAADIIRNFVYSPEFVGSLINLVRHWTGKLVPTSQTPADSGDFTTFDEAVPNPHPISYYESQIGSNLLLYSEEYDNLVGWGTFNFPTVTPGGDDPFGRPVAVVATDDDGVSYEGFNQTVRDIHGYVPGVNHTVSMFVRKDSTGRAVRFMRYEILYTNLGSGGVAERDSVFFDTATGEFTWVDQETGSGVFEVEDFNTNWWRLHLSGATNDILNDRYQFGWWPAYGSGASWTPNTAVTGSVTVAGSQVVAEGGKQVYVSTTDTRVTGVPEIDIDFDDQARVWGEVTSQMVWSDIGVANPTLEIDYRLEGVNYDGFEPWSVGLADLRYVKNRITFNNIAGEVYTVSDFNFTVDNIEKIQKATKVNIAASGSLITFPTPFHAIPFVRVFAEGTSSLFATYEQVTTTSFIMHIWDQSGTDVGGVGSWEAIGV